MSDLRPQSASAFAVSNMWDKPESQLRSNVLDTSDAQPIRPAVVVLADSDAAARHGLADLVAAKHSTASIIHASDGPEALAAMKQHEVGLALVDRCLQGLDGSEFLKELRSSVRSTMLALLSDQLVPQWAKVARAIGAYDVLLKPIKPRHIDNLMSAYSRTCLPTNALVVESSRRILDLVAGMLRRSVFRLNLDLCDTAGDAFKALVPEFYDLAILNSALPDASGVETAFQLLARSPGMRVITYGNQTGLTPASLKRLGVAAHLPTPFEPYELELALHDALGLWHPYALKALGKVEKLDQGGVDYLFR